MTKAFLVLALLGFGLVPAVAGALGFDARRMARRSTATGVVLASLLAVMTLADPATAGPFSVARPVSFALVVIAAITLVVQTYAERALDPAEGRVFAIRSSSLLAATVAVATATSFLVLSAAWIVAGTVVVGLVASTPSPDARLAAARIRRAFLVGDVALIGAAVTVAWLTGATHIADLAVTLEDQDLRLAGVGLIDAVAMALVVAGLARTALVPFHRWLPGSLAAPTPVSALLHAGVVNAAGILWLRTAGVLGASTIAVAAIFLAGAATTVLGVAVMRARVDAKGRLAWSTTGQMGFMAVQIATGALPAALLHLAGHAMYKAAAFLGVGSLADDLRRARHAPRPHRALRPAVRIPITAILATVAVVIGALVAPPEYGSAGTVLTLLAAWALAVHVVGTWLARPPLEPLASLAVALLVIPAGIATFGVLAALKALIGDVPAIATVVPPAAVVAVALIGGLLELARSSLAPGRLRIAVGAHLTAIGRTRDLAPVPVPRVDHTETPELVLAPAR
jgi:NADH:ubiquinone oxidoreductase subunit 5 (subunit L)/multisubunit Na+/H+ antiporter MnhA subunit